MDPVDNLKLQEPPWSGRTKYLSQWTWSDVVSLQNGIFFIIAYWSGPSRVAFAKLRDALLKFDPDGKIDVVIADIDGASEEIGTQTNAGLTGAGEAFWKANGEHFATTSVDTPSMGYEKTIAYIRGE